MAKKERPTWFRMFLHYKPVIKALPDACVGKALCAAMDYFDLGTEPDLDETSMIFFAMLQDSIDESYDDYMDRVKRSRENYRRRKGLVTTGDDCTSLTTYTETKTKNNHNIYTDTQADTQAETDTQTQADTERFLSDMSEDELRAHWREKLFSPAELQKDAAFREKAASSC